MALADESAVKRAALRPVPAEIGGGSGEAGDKENAPAAAPGAAKAPTATVAAVRGRTLMLAQQQQPVAGSGLEAALRRGLSERFAHVSVSQRPPAAAVVMAPRSAADFAAAAAAAGPDDSVVAMDVDNVTATWVS